MCGQGGDYQQGAAQAEADEVFPEPDSLDWYEHVAAGERLGDDLWHRVTMDTALSCYQTVGTLVFYTDIILHFY